MPIGQSCSDIGLYDSVEDCQSSCFDASTCWYCDLGEGECVQLGGGSSYCDTGGAEDACGFCVGGAYYNSLEECNADTDNCSGGGT